MSGRSTQTPKQISHATRLQVQNEIRLLSARESEYQHQLDDMLLRGIQGTAVENMISCILTAAHTKAGLIKYLESSKDAPGEEMVSSRQGHCRAKGLLLVLLFAALMLAVKIWFG